MKWSNLDTALCPIARSLSVIGDRWTLLIVRDCLMGSSRFEAFHASLGMTRHILSDRLTRLVDAGVLVKTEYARGRYDYELTEAGRALEPALRELFKWGKAHKPLRRQAT